MKVVVAIDSLKGSLSSLEAGNAIKEGILGVMPDAVVLVRPLVDGGEGTVEALALGMNGKLETITDNQVIPELKECTFRIACDVTNPLCGEKGCSAIFGPQKGATPAMISEMDQWLGAYAALTANKYEKADAKHPGTGAAGGMGFAFLSYTNAVLESGIKIVLEETKLEEYIKDADIVVTGEGRLDGQTVFGKAPIGVADIAKKHNKMVLAFSGCVTDDAVACNDHGIDAFFPILRNVCTLQEAMDGGNARANMIATVGQVFRLINVKNNE